MTLGTFRCSNCGIAFARDKRAVRSDHVYCTRTCMYEGISQRRAKPNTHCAACRRPIHVKPHRLDRLNYCRVSRCRAERGVVTLHCDACAKEVKRGVHQVREGAIHCSEKCRGRARRRKAQGLPPALERTTYALRDSAVKLPRQVETAPKRLTAPVMTVTRPADSFDSLLTRSWNNEQYAIRSDDGVDELQD